MCLQIWETKTGTCTQQLKAHTGTIYSLTLLPSGYLVSASGDNTYMVICFAVCLALLVVPASCLAAFGPRMACWVCFGLMGLSCLL